MKVIQEKFPTNALNETKTNNNLAGSTFNTFLLLLPFFSDFCYTKRLNLLYYLMKRTYSNIQNSNNASKTATVVLEGVVVAITDIFDSQTDKKGKYWTALICDANQNVKRITKYLSSKTKCTLH